MFRLTIDAETSLHPVEERHAPELFALTARNRARLRAWLPWPDAVTREEHTREFIRTARTQLAAGNGFQTALLHGGVIAGMVGLHYVDRLNGTTSIGYWLDAAHEGRGLATRAVACVLDHIFGELALELAEIRAATGNRRSRALAERLGFREDGTLRLRERLHDRRVDHVVYSLLASEWPGRDALG